MDARPEKPISVSTPAAEDLFLRRASLIKPAFVDHSKRTVRIVAITDKIIYKWLGFQGRFGNVAVLIQGIEIPKEGRAPLLDTHNAGTVESVLGSAGNFVKNDHELICDVHFSGTARGREAFQNVTEGHLTDFSVGLRVAEYEEVPAGGKRVIQGRSFDGPVFVATKSKLMELSLTVFGADPDAKPVYPKPPEKSKTSAADLLFYGLLFVYGLLILGYMVK